MSDGADPQGEPGHEPAAVPAQCEAHQAPTIVAGEPAATASASGASSSGTTGMAVSQLLPHIQHLKQEQKRLKEEKKTRAERAQERRKTTLQAEAESKDAERR